MSLEPCVNLKTSWALLGARARELEPGKAESGEEAEFTSVNEHSEPDSNAVWPTRSSPFINDWRGGS
ncbi:hypothetical protein PSEUDO9AZ_20294 [Pseudomonas sp. 9AZ]|nr:hypothetical protein PSEUDO9AZ_20294 [Pseudomonas sp. 9AZ]